MSRIRGRPQRPAVDERTGRWGGGVCAGWRLGWWWWIIVNARFPIFPTILHPPSHPIYSHPNPGQSFEPNGTHQIIVSLSALCVMEKWLKQVLFKKKKDSTKQTKQQNSLFKKLNSLLINLHLAPYEREHRTVTLVIKPLSLL